MMYRTRISGVLPGVMTASALAGPVFLVMVMLTSFVASLPQPVELPAEHVAQFGSFLLLSVLVGFFLAFVPNLFGALLMAMVGEHVMLARAPSAWALVGAMLGALLAILLDFGRLDFVVVAFAITSATCARLCRAFVDWHDPG